MPLYNEEMLDKMLKKDMISNALSLQNKMSTKNQQIIEEYVDWRGNWIKLKFNEIL